VIQKGQGHNPIIWGPLSRRRLEIFTWCQWSTYRKWLQGITWSRERWRNVTLNGQDRDIAWP